MKNWRRAACAVVTLLLGCQTASPAQRPAAPVEEARVSFINKVWKVGSSPTIEKGMLYVFLSEGTLVLASPHATPAFGKWEYTNGALTTIEESIRYKVDILKLTRDEFRIRIHNPGEPVDITLIPAEGEPVLAAAPPPAPAGLDGDWIVDLTAKPGDPPYRQPMQLTLTPDGTVSGSFYRSTIEAGRWKADRGRTCVSFHTTDGKGPYHTSACLSGDTVQGQTWAEHRGFLFNWNATRGKLAD